MVEEPSRSTAPRAAPGSSAAKARRRSSTCRLSARADCAEGSSKEERSIQPQGARSNQAVAPYAQPSTPQNANARRRGGTGAFMGGVRDRVDFRGAARMSVSNAQAQIDLHRELAPRYAYRYSLRFSRLFQEDWHAEMISHVPAGSRRALDLGCGTGFFLAELE